MTDHDPKLVAALTFSNRDCTMLDGEVVEADFWPALSCRARLVVVDDDDPELLI